MAIDSDNVAFGDIVCNPAGQDRSQAVLGTLGRQTLEGPAQGFIQSHVDEVDPDS